MTRGNGQMVAEVGPGSSSQQLPGRLVWQPVSMVAAGCSRVTAVVSLAESSILYRALWHLDRTLFGPIRGECAGSWSLVLPLS